MKIRFLALASAALVAGQAAQASDGTITFGGVLIDNTCTISGGGNKAVTLPTLSKLSVTGNGATGGDTYFNIAVTGCSAGLATANAFFEAGPTIDANSGRLINNSTTAPVATGVQIQILNKNGIPLDLSKPFGNQGTIAESITGNAATLSFIARYYATGTTGAGTVASSVTYSMVYN